MSDDHDWSDGDIAELRRSWAAGYSTTQIAEKLGVTKCAVVGNVDRLHLHPRRGPYRRRTERPSPIVPPPKLDPPPEREAHRVPTLAELVPLASLGQAAR